MRLTLYLWRQKSPNVSGEMVRHEVDGITADMSFLEMLDTLNEQLSVKGDEPIVFDSDCREGICGACSLVINGVPHGPGYGSTTCQLYMRHFQDGDTIYIEPFRSGAFPIVRDLMTDRSSLDRVIQAGGYISVAAGPKPEPNANLIPFDITQRAMDAAACIGCGACVAACPNGSAMLFTAAKVSHLGALPQGQPERQQRVTHMVQQMDHEGFGSCRNYAECQAVCPKEISIDFIGQLNRDYQVSSLVSPQKRRGQLKSL